MDGRRATRRLPELSNFCCLPGRAGGSPLVISLTQTFAEDATKQAQWRAFIRRTAIALAPEPLPELLRSVAAFVTPPLLALGTEAPFESVWRPGGPWA